MGNRGKNPRFFGIFKRFSILRLYVYLFGSWPLALTTNCSCSTDTLDLSIVALYAHLSSTRGTPSFLLSGCPSRL